MLLGKRLVITGVLTRDSIAYAVAARAQELGAEVVLTGFGRGRRLTERAARSLPTPPDVLELDVNEPDDAHALRAELEERWGSVDGLLHSIAYAPPSALCGEVLATGLDDALLAVRTSAISLAGLVSALRPLLAAAPGPGASVIAMDFDAPVALVTYEWMGIAKATLRRLVRYLARDLGAEHIRVNLIGSGPLLTAAGGGFAIDALCELWEYQAPLGWDRRDATPVADAVMFLFSDLSRAISGELLHVDGGTHAIGAPVWNRLADPRFAEVVAGVMPTAERAWAETEELRTAGGERV